MPTDQQRAWAYRSPEQPRRWQQPKLTNEQRQEIRRRYEAGESIQDLAAAYGVSRSTINRYR
ncbi:helix-turn-helix domain-containing protein [Streptomyces griseoincarnatus]